MAKKQAEESVNIVIPAPNRKTIELKVEGTSPYVQLRFSKKTEEMMMERHRAGGTAKAKKNREARDFDEDYKQAQYISTDGYNGINAMSFKAAMVNACRVVNYKMTVAKAAFFVEPDGFDKFDGTPLVRIIGTPHPVTHAVRNATGVADIRCRAMWDKWSAKVKISYDADMLTATDIVNLIQRAGAQCGIGEGRMQSKNSVGMGWGSFRVVA